MNIGKIIAKRRKEKNFNQEQLAEAAEISQSYISRIEQGKEKPSLELLERIAVALDVPVATLMGDPEDPTHELQSNARLIPPGVLMWVPVISPEVKVCAGNGNDYENTDLEWTVIEHVPVADGELAALYSAENLLGMYVEGDSMEPQIHDGDIVVFNHDTAWVPGNVMVVCLDGKLMVKGILSRGEGKPPLLRSANKDYADISVSEDSFFLVYGRVLRILRVTRPKPVI